jgi:hypothetical protein
MKISENQKSSGPTRGRRVRSEIAKPGGGHDATSGVSIDRAFGLACVMATPEIASSPPTINFESCGRQEQHARNRVVRGTSAHARYFRSSPVNGRSQASEHVPKVPEAEVGRPYSITSSICASGDAGTVRPERFGSFEIADQRDFAGCWTGQSSGRLPCFHCMKPSARTFPVARLAVPTPQICRSLTQA